MLTGIKNCEKLFINSVILTMLYSKELYNLNVIPASFSI